MTRDLARLLPIAALSRDAALAQLRKAADKVAGIQTRIDALDRPPGSQTAGLTPADLADAQGTWLRWRDQRRRALLIELAAARADADEAYRAAAKAFGREVAVSDLVAGSRR